MWLDQGLIQICERLGFWQYTLNLSVPTVTYVVFMSQRRSGTCSFDVRCRVQSHVRCIFMNLS